MPLLIGMLKLIKRPHLTSGQFTLRACSQYKPCLPHLALNAMLNLPFPFMYSLTQIEGTSA